ncbi:cell division site-positioning protein MapZ family protein [Streptococcus gallinaceus]|uniref:Mid-cell-anchored protein Z n=1 Tax=Streptococcus gallinaceus TaxID=165758 RepID=A0ABV2JMX5_9STRE|nr:hypothetical protein [Streptococcus gallinaceus]MCP1771011.1 hypothetical protein [Streptococcus gallinaceus]
MAEKDEEVLDFEKAKEMTVGEAARRQEDLEVGISEDDNILDRYIKKHREAIEADKFETKVHIPIIKEEDLTVGEKIEELGIHKVQAKEDIDLPVEEKVVEEAMAVIEPVPVLAPKPTPTPVVDEEWEVSTEEEAPAPDSKKKIWIWAALVALFVGILASVFVWMNGSDKNTKTTVSSSTTSQSSTTSSSAADVAVTNFENLYKTFFTDASLKNLKNSQFGKLADLKALLDRIDNKSTAYKDAKAKYDNLEKAIKAVQALNGQFDKAVIQDGQVDTSATVKEGQNLTAAATGLESVDAAIASAVNFGRSQQANASAAKSAASTAPAPATPAETPSSAPSATTTPAPAPATPAGTTSAVIAGDNPLYGIAIPAGVTLQRELSRVPYDWDKINNDPTNEAWNFNEGVLEKIIATSQARGYVSGNQYILEKVNIINGKGYYNLYKPDGTYLFSINAKTGYFVGNGSGHADALDF